MQKGILLIICFILVLQLHATDTCQAMIQANFRVPNVCLGSEAQFTNTSISDPNQSYYSWKFGDGNVSSQKQPRHVYDTAQSFVVWLKVVLNNGCSDSIFHIVNIKELPSTCNFDIIRDTSTSSTTYQFTPTGGPLAGISYTWLTGDGNTITSSSSGTTYSYAAAGNYCVTMISKNESGCECSFTKCITLTAHIKNTVNFNNLLTIFPNPTNGIFNIKSHAYVNHHMLVEIYNSIGELVKTVTVDGNNTHIDLSTCTNGAYIVKVVADNQVAIKQIILNQY